MTPGDAVEAVVAWRRGLLEGPGGAAKGSFSSAVMLLSSSTISTELIWLSKVLHIVAWRTLLMAQKIKLIVYPVKDLESKMRMVTF